MSTTPRTPVALLHRSAVGRLAAAAITLAVFGAGPAVGLYASAAGHERFAVAALAPAPTMQAAVVWPGPVEPEPELPASAASGEGADDEPDATDRDAAQGSSGSATTERAGPGETPRAAASQGAPAGGERRMMRAPEPEARADASAAPPARRGRRCESDRVQPLIERVSKGHFAVDRELVQSYARSLSRLNELGWSRPHEGPDGRNDGMLVGGVRCGSDLHQAGLRSGDVVHTVNGRPVKSFPQALLVYRKVRNDPTVRVELTRRGERRTLVYDLS